MGIIQQIMLMIKIIYLLLKSEFQMIFQMNSCRRLLFFQTIYKYIQFDKSQSMYKFAPDFFSECLIMNKVVNLPISQFSYFFTSSIASIKTLIAYGHLEMSFLTYFFFKIYFIIQSFKFAYLSANLSKSKNNKSNTNNLYFC